MLFLEAKKAENVVFTAGGVSLTFEAMEMILEKAQPLKTY